VFKRIIALSLVLMCGGAVGADYPADRKTVMALVFAGKHQEALAAFMKMAEGPISDFQESDALEQAVLCANSLKQYDKAMDLAKKIPLQPVSRTCQMRILMEERKWQEVIDKFKDEDIDRWPEDVAANAFHCRGGAYYNLKDGKGAEKDLQKAAELLTEDNAKGLALNALGDTYQHLLKDDNLAIETYRRVYKTSALYKHCQAAISIAGIFKRQNKPDEALQELNKIDMGKVTIAYWRAAMLAAFADVLAKQGRKAEAIAKYNEAMQLRDIHPAQKRACEKELRKLQADAK
jgi:tetratricopeptide (TPR) repeat protein